MSEVPQFSKFDLIGVEFLGGIGWLAEIWVHPHPRPTRAEQLVGFRVRGVGCRVWGMGCGVWGVGCGVWGAGCGV